MSVGLPHFLTVSAFLFSLGLFAVMHRRNAFVAFSRYVQHGIDGQIMTAFVIVLAAAEAAVALAIVLAMYRNFGTPNADTIDSLKR